jgi:hypothetical protein
LIQALTFDRDWRISADAMACEAVQALPEIFMMLEAALGVGMTSASTANETSSLRRVCFIAANL